MDLNNTLLSGIRPFVDLGVIMEESKSNIANIDKMSGPGPKSARPGRIFGALRKARKTRGI